MTTRSQIRLYHLSSILIASLIATVLVNLLTYYGPRIEGTLWPVARSTETTIEILATPNKIMVGGTMDKVRKCDLISTVAYVSDIAGNRVIAKIEPGTTVTMRPLERASAWGPWRLDVPFWFRQATLTVFTTHQCHPFWQTRTEFVRAVID